MISRVKSLQGLMVLRPFHQSKISCNLQQDVHDKLKRQCLLELSTLARHGDGDLANTAAKELADRRLDELLNAKQESLNLENCNLNTIIQRQNGIETQLRSFFSESRSPDRTKRHRTQERTCKYPLLVHYIPHRNC